MSASSPVQQRDCGHELSRLTKGFSLMVRLGCASTFPLPSLRIGASGASDGAADSVFM